MKNLISNLKRGDQLRITGFEASNEHAYRARLLAMGLTPGTPFTISRVAPLGDPIELEARGYRLSLRKHEAAILKVERINL